jgi:hypothetical protein
MNDTSRNEKGDNSFHAFRKKLLKTRHKREVFTPDRGEVLTSDTRVLSKPLCSTSDPLVSLSRRRGYLLSESSQLTSERSLPKLRDLAEERFKGAITRLETAMSKDTDKFQLLDAGALQHSENITVVEETAKKVNDAIDLLS